MNTTKNRIRLICALVISVITLLLALLYVLKFYDSSLTISVKGSALIAIALSVVAFVTALKLRSPLVGVLLTIAGMLMFVPPVSAIVADGTVTFPGPILGVISFSPIIVLGIAKLITTSRRSAIENKKTIAAPTGKREKV
jgi:hypothetical protein